jgi:outer membrane protein assembly factor BamB
MPTRASALFVGTKGTVIAVDRRTGETLWESELKGAEFVDVMIVDGELFAASKGRLYKLDPVSGDILWRNDLPAMGWGIVSIAGSRAAGAAEQLRGDEATAAVVAASA